ncbi:hypothetical protein NXW76_24425 [Bacteroides thetaiotaomicron]|nr:hypothetical protein [Bacteroides thetaiotaomicron]
MRLQKAALAAQEAAIATAKAELEKVKAELQAADKADMATVDGKLAEISGRIQTLEQFKTTTETTLAALSAKQILTCKKASLLCKLMFLQMQNKLVGIKLPSKLKSQLWKHTREQMMMPLQV